MISIDDITNRGEGMLRAVFRERLGVLPSSCVSAWNWGCPDCSDRPLAQNGATSVFPNSPILVLQSKADKRREEIGSNSKNCP